MAFELGKSGNPKGRDPKSVGPLKPQAKKKRHKALTLNILNLDLSFYEKEIKEEISKFPLGLETLNQALAEGHKLTHELLISIAQVCGGYSKQSYLFISDLRNRINGKPVPQEPEKGQTDDEEYLLKRAEVLARKLEERKELLGLSNENNV